MIILHFIDDPLQLLKPVSIILLYYLLNLRHLEDLDLISQFLDHEPQSLIFPKDCLFDNPFVG